jgi:hypothetical protein
VASFIKTEKIVIYFTQGDYYMKQLMKSLLAALLVVSAAHPTTHTNQTFMMPRPLLRNKAMEVTSFHRQINKKNPSRFGGSVQATVFYQQSENRKAAGKYFGYTNSTTKEDVNAIDVVKGASTEDLFNVDIFHNSAAYSNTTNATAGNFNTANQVAATPLGGTLRLKPRQTAWGVRLDYYQSLEKLVDGLYFQVSTPIAEVRNNLHATVENSEVLKDVTVQDTQASPANHNFTFGTNTGKGIVDFFNGTLSQTANPNKQDALANALIDGRRSTTEVCDIEVRLGYNVIMKDDKHIGLNTGLVIPTGNTPNGKYLFEAVGGQGNKWAFGAGFDSAFNLWKSGKNSLELLAGLDYRFVFEGTEKRTLGLIKAGATSGSTHAWYRLLGKSGVAGLMPAANVTTRDVKVEAGSQVDGIVALSLNVGNWTFDGGYNLYAQEAEKVSVKQWEEGTYGVADFKYSSASNFDLTSANHVYQAFGTTSGGVTALTKAQLDTKGASTPSQVTHKAFGGVGYAFNQWKYPLMLNLGGSYEFSDNNAALENWAAWGKIGLTF